MKPNRIKTNLNDELSGASLSAQVEGGSAKAGRDFTHSSAALIQFDTGRVQSRFSV